MHLWKDANFLTSSFKVKFRKSDTSVKQKHTKTNENVIISALSTNFCKTEILFSMQWIKWKKLKELLAT